MYVPPAPPALWFCSKRHFENVIVDRFRYTPPPRFVDEFWRNVHPSIEDVELFA